MAYRVSDAPGGNVTIVPHCNSFVLYFSFDLIGVPLTITSYYACILAVHDSNFIQAHGTTSVPWPLGVNQSFRIDRIDSSNNVVAGRTITWLGGNAIDAKEVHLGTGDCKLHVAGNQAAAGAPPPALAGWAAAPAAPPGQVAGGAPYLPQQVTINVPNAAQQTRHVHAPWKSFQGNTLHGLGYVGPINTGTGFDALLTAAQPGNPFPVFGFPSAPNANIAVGGAPATRGCALVAAGSFKEQINLLSSLPEDLISAPPGNAQAFVRMMLAMVGQMECCATAENCDDYANLPNDRPSADDPVEVVLFHNAAAL